jgi:hypothetical protein
MLDLDERALLLVVVLSASPLNGINLARRGVKKLSHPAV